MKRILISLLEWTPKRLARWEKIRAKGMARYILTRGCGYGVFWALSIALSYYMVGDNPSFMFSSLENAIIVFVCTCPMGLLQALYSWIDTEKSYFQVRQRESQVAMEGGNVVKV